MTVGERIRAKRIELGITQDELARRCGYASRSSINKIELSRTLPSDKIEIVANALGVRPSYIMGWESDNIVKSFSSYTKVADDALSVTRDTDEALSVVRDVDEALSVVRNVESMKPVEVYPPEAHRTKDKYEFALLQMYRELNEEGQEKLLNYADDLLSSNKYIKNIEPEAVEESS